MRMVRKMYSVNRDMMTEFTIPSRSQGGKSNGKAGASDTHGSAGNGRRRGAREPFVIGSLFANCRVPNAHNTGVGTQIRAKLRKWQSSSDPSTNHSIECSRQYFGAETAKWFFEEDTFKEWKVTGLLLWIHGKRIFFYSL